MRHHAAAASPQAFAGMVTVVTGAGRGIGEAIALRFAAEGSDVVLVARTASQLDGVARAVRDLGRRAVTVPADVTDATTADSVVAQAISCFGRLDVLVNNAGGAAPKQLLETTRQDLLDAFRLNVIAGFELTTRAVPHLLESDGASVINVSSRMDRVVSRGFLTYGTVKAATSHMTRLLAAELAPLIRVNAIAPGAVATETLREALDEPTRRHVLDATPLHRLATVEDVAHTALWLASPESSYLTGKIIEVDGGTEGPFFPVRSPDLTRP